MTPASTTPVEPDQQRDALLDSQRDANQSQSRNFKEDALGDKVVSVAPDGTGPTPTDTFDPATDQALGSGNDGGDAMPGDATRSANQPDQPDQEKTGKGSGVA